MKTLRLARRAVTLLAVVLAGAILWLVVASRPRSVEFADGRRVAIAAVTYGTNHVFIDGTLLGKLARPFVSRARAYQWGLRVYQQITPQPSLFVWTRWSWKGTNSAPRFASIRDEHGLESEPESILVASSFLGTDGAVLGWKTDNFPRTERGFTLRFYERDLSYRPSLAGEIQVASPVKKRAGLPPASLAPVTRRNAGVEFTLVSLRTGERPPEALTNRYFFEVIHRSFIARPTMAWFEVRENGLLSTNWTIRGVEVTSDSGNRFSIPSPLRVEESAGRLGIAFAQIFWPDEPAWKIRVEFARSKIFPTNRSWTIPNIPAGLRNNPFTTNVALAAHGVTLETVGVQPRVMIPYRRSWYRRNAEVSLVYTTAVPALRVDLASVIDNYGQPLRFGHGTDVMKGRYVSSLELLTNTTAVDLTFVAHSAETVEFRVRPELVLEPGAAK